jgi:hypothetical protein
MATPKGDNDRYPDREARERTETALRAAFSTPHKTYEDSKLGKRKVNPTKSPVRQRPVDKRR